MQKLLHVFPEFAFGGQQTRFAVLARNFSSSFSHTVVSLNGNTGASELVHDLSNVSVVPLKLRKSSFIDLENQGLLRDLLKSENPDLLCTYNWGSMEAVIANGIYSRRPHIHFEDGFGPDETLEVQLKKRVITRRMLLRRAQIVTPSKGLDRLARETWKLPESRLHYIPNGIDLSRFSIARDVQDDVFTIGSVGAMRPEKNFARLIRAFAQSKFVGDSMLVLVGDGPDLERLKELATDLGVGERVEFPGRSQTPEAWYSKFDLYAISSDTEQMPLGLMEAMAAGCAVTSVRVGDIADMVADGNAPYITPAGDEQALSKSFEALEKNREVRRRLGEENKCKATTDFALSDMVKRHEALYLTVMGAKNT